MYGGALSQNALMAYSFGYDTQNRLTNASLTGGSASFSLATGYDSNGNITSLSRVFNGSQVDNLSYSYAANSNRLSGVTDAATSSLPGFFGANASYTYDANGNLLTDSGKGITSITYNVLNLPQTVPLSSSTVSYTYTATGQKLRATFPGNKQYDYVAGLVYESNKLEFIPTAEGRILPPGRAINPTSTTEAIANRYYRYEYQLKDHLGNLRVACRCPEITTAVTGSQLPGPGDTYPLMVMQEEQYDPWGLSLTGLTNLTVANASRFKYINREEQQGLGWIDLMARQYDPQTGRFTGVDPLPDTEGQESLSSYHYSYNNPIRFSDPDGKLGSDCCDGIGSFFMGVGGAIRDNLSPDGGGSFRDTPANASAYNTGREVGHRVSMVIAAGEIAAGLLGDGAALAGEVVTLGAATIPAAGLAVASTGAIVHGGNTANNAVNNIRNDKGRLEARSSSREGKDFTPKEKQKVIDENRQKNNGKVLCENCGVETTQPQKSQKGVTPPRTDRQIDH